MAHNNRFTFEMFGWEILQQRVKSNPSDFTPLTHFLQNLHPRLYALYICMYSAQTILLIKVAVWTP